MFYDDIISILSFDKEYQEKLAAKLETELKALPAGSLYRKVVAGKPRYYHRIPSECADKSVKYQYISNKRYALKAALKRKEIIKRCLPILYHNIKLEELFISKYKRCDPKEIENSLPRTYADVTCDYLYDDVAKMQSVISWEQEPYLKNESYPEKLKHNTISGIKVRSKSEGIIADLLTIHNIPFRYEAQLILNKQTIYPDFTILRPRDGKILYWEHFGMADSNRYSLSMHRKIDTYIENEIIPGTGLIMSFETENEAIDPIAITAMIKAYIIG